MRPAARDRLLAAALFAAPVALGWVSAAVSLGGTPTPFLVQTAVFGALAGAVVGALAAPTLAAEARRGAALYKGAALGLFVAVAGHVGPGVLGVTVVAIVAALTSPDATLTLADAGQTVGLAAAGIAATLVVGAPGLALGAGAGALYYRLVRATRVPA